MLNPELLHNRKFMIPASIFAAVGAVIGIAGGFYVLATLFFWLEGRVLFTI